MKTLSLVITLLFAIPSTIAQTFEWAKNIGGTGSVRINSIAVDAAGNVYTTGYFDGTIDFEPGAGVTNLTAAGIWDIFVSKLSPSGAFVWVKTMGGNSYDKGNGITTDIYGNIYITGSFSTTVDFDPNAGTALLYAAGIEDVFVCKLDSSGALVWAKGMGGTSTDAGNSIALDAMGNIYTTGFFWNTADFDPNAGIVNLTAGGTYDVFVSKLDASGAYVWAKRLGGAGTEDGTSLKLDPAGNIYITGYFTQTADFNPNIGIANLTSAGQYDIFISKLNSSGNFVWAKNIGGTGFDKGHVIELDGLGSVYITGYIEDTVDFDTGSGVTNLTAGGLHNVFVNKIDSSGTFLWAKIIGGGNSVNYTIAVDAVGNIFIPGSFYFTIDFDPGIGVANLTSLGASDIFINKLDASGAFLWAKSMGGTSTDIARNIALDANGSIYITGEFSGTSDFDPDAGITNLTAVGTSDVFVHKMVQGTINITQINAIPLTFYPNPTNDKITIDAGSRDEIVGIQIINTLGQIISSQVVDNENITTIQLPPNLGVYFVNVQLKNGKTGVLKVLKE